MTTVVIDPRQGLFERFKVACIRSFLRSTYRVLVGPPFSAVFQRRCAHFLSLFMPTRWGVVRRRIMAAGIPVEITVSKQDKTSGAVLFIHGGGFCLGSPVTHRSLTSYLATYCKMPVWSPDYRLAPEHPYPAGLDDVICIYDEMLRQGYAAERIVIAGDSAGGSLALAMAIRLRDRKAPRPGGLILLSPVTDLTHVADAASVGVDDPMIRPSWLKQALDWYQCPPGIPEHYPLQTDLTGLPPILIQVGDQELLQSDSMRLAEHATRCGLDCRLEIHHGRWHVFLLQSHFLPSSAAALRTLANFASSATQSRHVPTAAAY